MKWKVNHVTWDIKYADGATTYGTRNKTKIRTSIKKDGKENLHDKSMKNMSNIGHRARSN